jgi:hypothetical protein
MIRMLRTWIPPVGTCLLLQAAIISTGLLVQRCLQSDTPCCDSPLVL